VGVIGSGSETVGVEFSGNALDEMPNYPSYTPASTWADGVFVDNGPTASNGILQLTGGSDAVQTITFSRPVLDPVLAIWSLGQTGTPASFVFQNATPIFVAGGPNAEHGGSPLNVSGSIVSGEEVNGTIRFSGVYTSLSWTNPQAEYWYGFDVGVPSTPPVPEPSSWALMLVGGLLLCRSRGRRGAYASR
jgi:hypothetical protein